MPTDYLDSRYNYDFTGNDGTAYRLILVLGDVDDLTDPAVTPIELPGSFLLDDIKTDWGFPDKYSIGMLNEGVLKLKLDLTQIEGTYDGDATFWNDVRARIVKGQSATAHTNGLYIPNRWTLLSGSGYTNVEFDGFQVYNPEGQFKISNGSIEFEVTINDALSSILKSIKPFIGTGGFDEAETVPTYTYAVGGMHIYDVVYTVSGDYIVCKKENPSNRVSYMMTHANFWTFLLGEITRYGASFYRDATVTINTDITKPKTLSDTHELSYITTYKQDPTGFGESDSSLDSDDVLVYVKRTNVAGSIVDYGLLDDRTQEGWAEYGSLLDVFKFLSEGCLTKVITDFNPASGQISFGFHKIFERTLGTTQKVIENTGYGDADACSVATDDEVTIELAPNIVEVTCHYKNVMNGGATEYTSSNPKNQSEDSYEIQSMWQNNYGTIDSSRVSSDKAPDKRYVRLGNHTPCRNLYYTHPSGDYTDKVLKIHEDLVIDTGDGTITNSEDAVYLNRNSQVNWSDEVQTWEQWNRASGTSFLTTGFPKTISTGLLSILGRNQLMFTCKVDKIKADNSMLGDIYEIDIDSFLPTGFLATNYGNMGILVNVSVDYITGTTEATFWLPGRTL